ncbi:MFS general substrate transporter [Myriangium duriaei CBS 260.36]|uniref:Cercosporin MFS transporter CTB4 n=1 Tax=Myriangium duriaei CBS 260.36 TaxID=1168546 RepID=A0A9P4MPI1_9PEZI|nr:MFS general substrate transporter [Myriangium duriaei CBS 260.36]
MEEHEKEQVENTSAEASSSRHSGSRSLSVRSSDAGSISTTSEHHSIPHQYTGDAPELQLTPHISRATDAGGKSNIDITLKRTQTAGTSATNTDPAFEVDFSETDNPQNWSFLYKAFIIGTMSFGTTTVVLYSTSYTSAIPGIVDSFHISNQVSILGVTTYLLGLAAGSLVLAPLSEMYGRRPVYIISLACFALLVLPCALAKNIASILATRFFGAFAASAMISNAPGSVNDVVDEQYRALAFSVWSIGPMNGPVIGPVVGGFVFQYMGWRWTNWVVLIVSGAAWLIVSSVPETYAPAILRAKAAKKRKETDDERWWSRYDEKKSFWPLLKLNLSRPFVMTATEPILMFWDGLVGVVYGILYLCFVAYPIVFSEERGWSPGISGLAFCGIGLGSMIVICSEPLIRRVINNHKPDPVTGKVPPEAMIFPVCIASISMPIGELWFAWTCTPNVHWIWPILAGVPFGMGTSAIFIYASNYLVYSYGIYAASALAGNAVIRSVLGATLPLAGPALYKSLGSNWAGTLLAFLEIILIPIPFVFYRYGSKIRMKSVLIRTMQEDKEKQDRKRRRAAEKMERELEKRAEAEAGVGGIGEAAAVVDEQEDAEANFERV